ncbi:hypothetical protein ACFQI7_03990 [Paenibacillus allorhizosphaerae]|uniref:Uncharacterized protein n=1 Tax=Paenibacillus allorhizosphaerae TaxID=2849866 RepID=A0ABM8VD22_9BACL|nr:hypothetical protein [Paenibacillus allorhizosphaerae]CAG7624116.1 hypothetical protein PAECIP111802_01027 [Paenibacillus allorhizosphaerae]
MRLAKTIIVCICIIVTLAACGKNIPAIDPQLLQSKSSVLFITGPAFPEASKNKLNGALVNWRDTNHIAFEWMSDTSELSEQQWNKIKSVSYDYIVVAGHSLIESILPTAQQITSRKWIMLDDQPVQEATEVQSDHIMLKQVPQARLHAEWDVWVRQQLVSGRTIEWVTQSTKPIPSDWAPSEEAEYITLTDAEGWYPQFQFQARQHGANWIVTYVTLDQSVMNRLKNLSIPIVNMAATGIEQQWDAILSGLFDMMQNKSWKPGSQPYADSEVKIVKNL